VNEAKGFRNLNRAGGESFKMNSFKNFLDSLQNMILEKLKQAWKKGISKIEKNKLLLKLLT
jgi:hypothetical protein